MPRVTALDEARKNELMDVLTIDPNYGKCKRTMLRCLVSEKPDKTAVRFANFGGYLVSRGVPAQSLGCLAEERNTFLNQTAVQAFSTTGSPSLGNPMAGMVIAEFAEFKCP